MADSPILMVANHTRGEKVLMSPFDEQVSLDAVATIARILKWDLGFAPTSDNITIGTRLAFDDCDYAMYDKQGVLIYMPDSPDAAASESESDDEDDPPPDDSDSDDMEDELVGALEAINIKKKRSSDEAGLADREHMEA